MLCSGKFQPPNQETGNVVGGKFLANQLKIKTAQRIKIERLAGWLVPQSKRHLHYDKMPLIFKRFSNQFYVDIQHTPLKQTVLTWPILKFREGSDGGTWNQFV